jgi:hypothetical protein
MWSVMRQRSTLSIWRPSFEIGRDCLEKLIMSLIFWPIESSDLSCSLQILIFIRYLMIVQCDPTWVGDVQYQDPVLKTGWDCISMLIVNLGLKLLSVLMSRSFNMLTNMSYLMLSNVILYRTEIQTLTGKTQLRKLSRLSRHVKSWYFGQLMPN